MKGSSANTAPLITDRELQQVLRLVDANMAPPQAPQAPRQPFGAANVNTKTSSNELRLKLPLRGRSTPEHCKTERAARRTPQSTSGIVSTPPATARSLSVPQVGQIKSARYKALLLALDLLDAPVGPQQMQASTSHAKDSLACDSTAGEQAHEHPPGTLLRRHSEPLLLGTTASRALLNIDVGRFSLPSSPRLSDDMNIARQPDGEMSAEKLALFERGLQTLLRTMRSGSTTLEKKVEAKRSKHNSAVWQQKHYEMQREAGKQARAPQTTRHRHAQCHSRRIRA